MSTKQVKLICIFILTILLNSWHSYSANRYWVGNNSNKNWNVTANWSATSGGSGGASVPGVTDSVYFDNGGPGQVILDVNISIARFTMQASYTDTIKQNGKTITTTSIGMQLNGGTFLGNTGNISVSGNFTLAGTNFISTSSTLTISREYSFTSGNFVHNNGTVRFSGAATTNTRTISGSTDFYDLLLAPSGAITYVFNASSVFNVKHNLTESGTYSIKINEGTTHSSELLRKQSNNPL